MALQFENQDGKKADTASNGRPSVPDVLIHMHIPKTGGTSLSSMVKHGFREEQSFEWTKHGVNIYSALGVATQECCQRQLEAYGLDRVRYVSGHVPFGVHRYFDRPAKYITVLRHPVERVISFFYFLRQINAPFLDDGGLMTFEAYVEDGRDINLNDYQARILSGCPELDTPAPKTGALVSAAPVETHHLAQAKRIIDQHFLTIGTVEQMTELGLLLRRIYGWPMRRLQNEYKNPTKERPLHSDISPRLIRLIEQRNSYDIELYDWVGKRFAAQRQLFEPELTSDLRRYTLINPVLTAAGRMLPRNMRKRIAEILFYAR